MTMKCGAAVLAAVVAGWLGGCVVVDDPKHCANRDGDATCEKLWGHGVYCSACDHFYNGCVEDLPTADCRVDEPDSSASSDGSSSSDASSAGDATSSGDGAAAEGETEGNGGRR